MSELHVDKIIKESSGLTLVDPLISGAFDGWINANETWYYYSSSSFYVSGNVIYKYSVGDKIKLTQNSITKYFFIIGISYSSPNTIITVTGEGLYTLENATISLNYYNKPQPKDFPFGGYNNPYYNYFMNGGMSISQRGTSFSSVANGSYTLDRMQYNKIGGMVHTITRDTDVPASSGMQYSMKLSVTTADSVVDSGDLCTITQYIEGFIFSPLANKYATLSFWVRGAKTGIHSVIIKNGNSTRSYVAEYTINAINTWEFKIITVPIDCSSGTWAYDNTLGLQVQFSLMAGSTYTASPGSWVTGNYWGSVNQVNECDTVGNIFAVTKIMLNEGNVAMPYQPFGGSWLSDRYSCLRYFEKSYEDGVAFGTITFYGCLPFSGIVGSTTRIIPCRGFIVEKRTAPTITMYSPHNGDVGYVSNYSAGTGVAITDIYGTSVKSLGYYVQLGSAYTDGLLVGHYAANAELT